MNPEKTSIIYGPPGTGKTTELIRTVGALLEGGTEPERICYVAFTRKAAHEALERITAVTELPPARFPYFKTLHALAFYQMGFDGTRVLGIRDYFSLAEIMGLSITGKSLAEDGTFSGHTKGDRLFFMENMARTMGRELKEHWESMPDEDIYYYELEQVANTVRNYKEKHDKIDFTDLLIKFRNNGVTPDCDYLFVDEAQDLSQLQWQVVDVLSSNVRRLTIGGDDDQSIFRWAGADTDTFINLQGHRRVLKQSYRVPAEIHKVADAIANRIQIRVEKHWEPRKEPGKVEYINELNELNMKGTGTWLLLARNAFLLESYVAHCMAEGLLFESRGGGLDPGIFEAIKVWEQLCAGNKISAEQVGVVANWMTARTGIQHGFKGKLKELPKTESFDLKTLRERHGFLRSYAEPWSIVLDRIEDNVREYLLLAFANGEKLTGQARIRIDTIHSVKGGEADNVVLQTDMAYRTSNEMEKSPDDEHRVWYVAVTRARANLYVMSPKTKFYYNL